MCRVPERTHRLAHAVIAANAVNGSTALGLLVARLGGTHATAGPHGLLLAVHYRFSLPRADAFTLGSVVLTRRGRAWLLARPDLLYHEARHAAQYAWCGGPALLPLYAAAAVWSWLRTGDPSSRNAFERRAGLAAGGYQERPRRSRPLWTRPRGPRRLRSRASRRGRRASP